jgi:predicted lactoylglutathione lyase
MTTATAPKHPGRKLFVNLPVRDLARTVAFYKGLGFTFNPQFTDEGGTCMLVGEDAYFMLLTEKRFRDFTNRPVLDPQTHTGGMYAFSVASREEVDRIVKLAVETGGAAAMPPQDHGFMYGWSFLDPDGHHFEPFWMDPAAAQ